VVSDWYTITSLRIFAPFRSIASYLSAVQKYIRKTPGLPPIIGYLFYKKRPKMYFTFTTTSAVCTHVNCSCEVTIEGAHPITEGFKMTYPIKSSNTLLAEVLTEITNRVSLVDGVPCRVHPNPVYNYYMVRANSRSNKRVPGPFRGGSLPMDRIFYGMGEKLQFSLQQADRRYFFSYGCYISDYDCRRHVWAKTPTAQVPSLKLLAASSASWHNQVIHSLNGRPRVLSAASNLYPTKAADNIIKMLKETRDLPPQAAAPLQLLPKAIDMMFDKFGIHEFRTEPCVITIQDVQSMYLGSSGGSEPPHSSNIRTADGNKIKVSANTRKICKLQSDLHNVLNLIEHDIEFLVTYCNSIKDEHNFPVNKQLNDEEWQSAVNKCRIFTIPNSPLVVANKLVTRVRHLKERGHICIGHKWPRGGADRLAKLLGISKKNMWLLELVEGDIRGLDFSVHAFWTRLYYSFGLVHEKDDGSAAYAFKKKLLVFILKNVITRLTNAFGDIWELIFGKVPSGVLDTSHMDSWVKGLWFFLFVCFTISSITDKAERRRVARWAALIIAIIIYGDDFLYRKGVGAFAAYFSGEKYKAFLWDYFGVELRDLFDGISFCTLVRNGWIVKRGGSFLKQFVIPNPHYTPENGQCEFLPFRETREIMLRCFYGREPRARTVIDAISSCISHAYGTYGSNLDAYRMLRAFYLSLMYDHALDEASTIDDIVDRKSVQDMKQYRQVGMDIDDLKAGFPTEYTLKNKNVWDPDYHVISWEEMYPTDGLFMDYD